MTAHVVVVPHLLQRPTCSCGWAAPYPFRATWDEFDRQATTHLAAYVDCMTHGTQPLTTQGRCRACRREVKSASDQRRKDRG